MLRDLPDDRLGEALKDTTSAALDAHSEALRELRAAGVQGGDDLLLQPLLPAKAGKSRGSAAKKHEKAIGLQLRSAKNGRKRAETRAPHAFHLLVRTRALLEDLLQTLILVREGGHSPGAPSARSKYDENPPKSHENPRKSAENHGKSAEIGRQPPGLCTELPCSRTALTKLSRQARTVAPRTGAMPKAPPSPTTSPGFSRPNSSPYSPQNACRSLT